MRKTFLLMSAVTLVSFSAWAFGFQPDSYTTCLDNSATFLDGTQAPATGSCNITGEQWIEFEQDVMTITECQSAGPGVAGDCTGNGALHADVGPR